MISRATVWWLGASQLISWGISYYLIGAFGERIVADTGWSREFVYGGFALALVVMGLASSLAGRLIDQHGGARAMVAGSLLNAAGCFGLSIGHGGFVYLASWVLLGLGMRLTLYDAAFAALARIGGAGARRAMGQITLLGGLASTVFWPLGNALADAFGWRGALLGYVGFALLTAGLNATIPTGRFVADAAPGGRPEPAPRAASRPDLLLAGSLFALLATCANFLNAGMSSHLIGILSGFGLAAATAVWIGALRGIGQLAARAAEVLFGQRIDPVVLTLAAALVLPLCFAVGFLSGQLSAAAIAFAFFYGVGNGVLTITRGTLPLVLFEAHSYGAVVGRLLAPSFIVSAAAPLVYAWVLERYAQTGALWLSLAVALLALAAAGGLRWRFGPPSQAPDK